MNASKKGVGKTNPRGLYHKTYYSHNLWISVISWSDCSWKAFSASFSVCG
jgi:hypothetical protein